MAECAMENRLVPGLRASCAIPFVHSSIVGSYQVLTPLKRPIHTHFGSSCI
jgi:hypothetical protein